MKQLIAILLLAISITSCSHKKTNTSLTGDFLIAGRMGGFVVAGSYTNYYLISGGTLKVDTTVVNGNPPEVSYGFSFNTTLAPSRYEAVKNIPSSIPSELLAMSNQHIGNIYPDMGYIDVRTSIGGGLYHWYFEGDQSTSSPAIQHFVASLDSLFR
jgi:hypothetical protein